MLSVKKTQPRLKHQKMLSPGQWKLRVFFLIVLIGFLTWYARFTPHIQEPVRDHDFSGFVFPTHRGLSVLLIASDDGIDTNLTKTGHRLWIHPPKQPQKLEEEYLKFSGPGMTVFGDSLEIYTLRQLCSTIDSGGLIRILGKQIWEPNLLKSACPRQDLRVLPDSTQFLPLDPNLNLQTYRDTNHTIIAMKVTVPGHQLEFLMDSTLQKIPEADSSISLFAELLPLSKGKFQSYLQDSTQYRAVQVYRPIVPMQNSDSSIMLLSEKNVGVAFRIEQSSNRFLAQKIHLNSWVAASQ